MYWAGQGMCRLVRFKASGQLFSSGTELTSNSTESLLLSPLRPFSLLPEMAEAGAFASKSRQGLRAFDCRCPYLAQTHWKLLQAESVCPL